MCVHSFVNRISSLHAAAAPPYLPFPLRTREVQYFRLWPKFSKGSNYSRNSRLMWISVPIRGFSYTFMFDRIYVRETGAAVLPENASRDTTCCRVAKSETKSCFVTNKNKGKRKMKMFLFLNSTDSIR